MDRPGELARERHAADVLAKTKNITADNPASDSTPLYSPDGKYIAYRAQQRPGYESDRFRLMLYDRKTGEKKNLTEDFDRWVGTFAWSPDSETHLLRRRGGGRSPDLYRLPSIVMLIEVTCTLAYGFAMTCVVRRKRWYQAPTFDRGSVVQRADTTIDLRYARLVRLLVPTECRSRSRRRLYEAGCRKNVPSNSPQSDRLTHLNDAVLSQVAMSPLEPFWFTGAHGDKVEGFLVKPPNFDASKKYPVKFLIHGGPEGAWGDDWSIAGIPNSLPPTDTWSS